MDTHKYILIGILIEILGFFFIHLIVFVCLLPQFLFFGIRLVLIYLICHIECDICLFFSFFYDNFVVDSLLYEIKVASILELFNFQQTFGICTRFNCNPLIWLFCLLFNFNVFLIINNKFLFSRSFLSKYIWLVTNFSVQKFLSLVFFRTDLMMSNSDFHVNYYLILG